MLSTRNFCAESPILEHKTTKYDTTRQNHFARSCVPSETIPELVSVLVGEKVENLEKTFRAWGKRKVPDFLRNQELFGGDYWTRTSDLLRVKMRRDVKALILGAFRHFWPRFLWVQTTALSTVSTRWFSDIGQRIGQSPGCAESGGAGAFSWKQTLMPW